LNKADPRIDMTCWEYCVHVAPDAFNSSVRRPYYRMRGKPVTEEQAFEIIRKTDHYDYDTCRPIHDRIMKGRVENCHFKNLWFDKHHYPLQYGWAHPDGTIGINSITDRFPTFLEFLRELLAYQKAFPFLDFTVGIDPQDLGH